jgi:D-lactate dehydrogenase (cytochrome)
MEQAAPALSGAMANATGAIPGDVLALLAAVVGPSHLLIDDESTARYREESRGLYHGVVKAVVRPASTEEVAEVVRLCAAHGLSMVPQGGNTGTCGGAVPMDDRTIVIATERLDRIRELDPVDFTMTVEAGCILADLQAAADAAGCLFPLSLGGEGSCRIGGNLSTNAGGTNVLRYGNARDLMLGLEVVLPDGRVWNGLRALRKDNTGYALKHLFVGAEGTLGIVTAVALKLFAKPVEWHTAVVAIDSPAAALTLLARLRQASGDLVNACELIPRIGLDLGFKNLPGGREPFATRYPWYVLVELSSARAGGLRAVLEEVLERGAEDGLVLDAVLAESGEQRRALWRLREIMAGGHQHQEGALIKHDVSVPVSRVAELIARATAAVEEAWPGVRTIAFGHVGDGNVHFNLVQPVDGDGVAFGAARPLLNGVVHDIVDALGGSVSAEHGVGLLKIDEMARYKSGVELDLMHAVKQALDPRGLMNPGKVLPARASGATGERGR